MPLPVLDPLTRKRYTFSDNEERWLYKNETQKANDLLTEGEYYQYVSLYLKVHGTEI